MLVLIKSLHTIVWTFLVACILSIPLFGWKGQWRLALCIVAIVICEVLVLLANGWKCPITGWAARYTHERQENFDIYLPLWVARHNKTIFGILFFINIIALYLEWSLRTF